MGEKGTMKCDWDERARHRLWVNASGDEKSMVLRMTKGGRGDEKRIDLDRKR